MRSIRQRVAFFVDGEQEPAAKNLPEAIVAPDSSPGASIPKDGSRLD
jgi:hypothetical protein